MKSAADVLKTKADQAVYTITPDDTVFDAVKLMADKNIGALLVFEGSELAGMITERDYARKIALMSRSSQETRVREIMTSAVMYVRPHQTSEECMALIVGRDRVDGLVGLRLQDIGGGLHGGTPRLKQPDAHGTRLSAHRRGSHLVRAGVLRSVHQGCDGSVQPTRCRSARERSKQRKHLAGRSLRSTALTRSRTADRRLPAVRRAGAVDDVRKENDAQSGGNSRSG
jgi:CBS domain-containing protein